MFHKTITLSIFALLVAVASCRPQIELNECSGRENGLYADELDNNAFFVCLDDELVVHSKCDPGEFFDAELKACSGGLEDENLTAYSDESEVGDYVNNLESQVSDLEEPLESDEEEGLPNFPILRPPPSTPRPPSRPPPPPPARPPPRPFKNKIVNVQVTKNIFPKSVIVIGRANREQKNK